MGKKRNTRMEKAPDLSWPDKQVYEQHITATQSMMEEYQQMAALRQEQRAAELEGRAEIRKLERELSRYKDIAAEYQGKIKHLQSQIYMFTDELESRISDPGISPSLHNIYLDIFYLSKEYLKSAYYDHIIRGKRNGPSSLFETD